MDSTQAKIIELLREVHLLAIKEIERLNLRITELEIENRQRPPQEIAKPAERGMPAINPVPMKPASHPKPELMNEREVASLLGMSVPSIRRWRMFRAGPKFLKIGSAVRYRREDLDSWLRSCAGSM